jgi:hypothetical protein
VLDGRYVLEVVGTRGARRCLIKVKFYVKRPFITGQWEHSVPPDILFILDFRSYVTRGVRFPSCFGVFPKTNQQISEVSVYVSSIELCCPVTLGFWRTGCENSCADLSAVCRHVDIVASTRGARRIVGEQIVNE